MMLGKWFESVCVFFIYLFYVCAFGTDLNQFIIYVVYYLCIVFGA